VKLLLNHEASTNIVDAKGSSPLHLAAWSGNSEIVRLILSQGPSIPNVNLTVFFLESYKFNYVFDIFKGLLYIP
jgi:ankyrin repeat protein